MSENTAIKPLKALTIKTEEESVDRFKSLKEQLGIATDGQMFTLLLDRMEQPQKVVDRTDELQQQLEEAMRNNESLKNQNTELSQKLEEATGNANQNAELANAQQLAFEKQLSELKPKDNQAVITFTTDNLRVLDLVCARESQRRKQNWSRSHVINYFINARFVRGLLNGDLQSIPDSELRRLGISLKNPGKQEFDL